MRTIGWTRADKVRVIKKNGSMVLEIKRKPKRNPAKKKKRKATKKRTPAKKKRAATKRKRGTKRKSAKKGKR